MYEVFLHRFISGTNLFYDESQDNWEMILRRNVKPK
jgi:hypothetical protein